MLTHSIAALAIIATTAAQKTCMNMTVPVSIEARNAVFDKIETPMDNLGATMFGLSGSRQGSNGRVTVLSTFSPHSRI